MAAGWRQNQSKGTKNHHRWRLQTLWGFRHQSEGFEPVMFQQIAKPRICLRFCMGLVCNSRELSNSPSGFGVRNLTNVVDEPDAFINIEAR